MIADSRRPAGHFLAIALAVGGAWSSLLLWTIGFRLPPGPESPTQWTILILTCGALALAHGGLVALAGARVARLRHARAATTLALSLALGLFYSGLVLSLFKFLAVRSHLRASDLRFVLGSLAQVAGEATVAERRMLAFALVLPLVLASCAFAFLRRQRAHAAELPLRVPLFVLLAGLGALSALGAARAEARWLLRTLVPEGAIAVRWAATLGVPADDLPPPDPAFQQRIEPPPSVVSGDVRGDVRGDVQRKRWNVVVLMVESVPWKRLFGPEARFSSTPRFQALRSESVDFERAYAASVHSDYAQTSILASLYPAKSEQHDFFVDLDYPRQLPWDLLGPLGWRSALFSTQNERWGNMRAFLETPALGLFRHAPDFAGAVRRGSGIETKAFEESVVPAFLDWAGREPQRPFVAYLNFQATHFPYLWPDSFTPPFPVAPLHSGVSFLSYPREMTPAMLDRFHNALAYEDLWLGRLIDGLSALGAWENTALLVVADHGEAFHEHGLVTHGTALHEEQVRVPLLLRLPLEAPGGAPRTISAPVSVLDALPSLFAAMTLPRAGAHQGHGDLLDPAYAERSAVQPRPIPFSLQGMTYADGLVLGRFKWFVDRGRRQAALYDLAADPGESHNIAAAEPLAARRMNEELDRLFARQLGYYRSRAWEEGWYPPRLP